MLVIRPITLDDLEPLVELAHLAAFGLTSLPKDRDLLQTRVESSVHSFSKMSPKPGRPGGPGGPGGPKPVGQKPGGETYLFVMEDLTHGKIIGTTGIVSKVGGFDPFYAYQIETSVHESSMLAIRKEIRTLHLVREHNGPCEIGSLFLAPDYRKSGNGRLLSLSRFLFMAEHRDRFDPVVIAEMRGVIDDEGQSPFWEALGRHFFEVEYPTADYLCMVDKKFIADLMPTHPIYIPLLPEPAQRVIAEVHPNTRGAIKILESEGFTFSGMVDIFEAGPIISSQLENIRTVRESQTATVTDITDTPITDTPPSLIAATNNFRVTQAPLIHDPQTGVTIDQVTALTLQVRVNDTIRFVSTRPQTMGSPA